MNFRLLITEPAPPVSIEKIPTEFFPLRVAVDEEVIVSFLFITTPSSPFAYAKSPFKIILSPELALSTTV